MLVQVDHSHQFAFIKEAMDKSGDLPVTEKTATVPTEQVLHGMKELICRTTSSMERPLERMRSVQRAISERWW